MSRVCWSQMALWLILLALPAGVGAQDPLMPPQASRAFLWRQSHEPGLRAGAFDLNFRATGAATYDDNITLAASNELEDVIFTIAPAVRAVLDRRAGEEGGQISLMYEPALKLFLDHDNNNTLDHNLEFNAEWAAQKWELGARQTVEITKSGVIEVGRRVRQRYYVTNLRGEYKFTEKLSAEISPRLAINDVDTLIGFKDYGVDGFLNWQFTPRLKAGAGGSLGHYDIDENPSQDYQRALGRLTYSLTERCELTASAGGEWRQYDSMLPDRFTVVFGLGGTYQMTDRLVLAIEAHRRELPSLQLDAQDFTSTGGSAQLRQRLFDTWFLSLGGGYDNFDYKATAASIAATRKDDYYFVRAGFGAEFGRHWTAGVYFQHQNNDSTQDDRTFDQNQVTFEVTWSR